MMKSLSFEYAWWDSMRTSKTTIEKYVRQGMILCLLLSLFFLPSCGVYSKVPPVNPNETPVWSGPLLENADMEDVRIYIKPNQRTITLNMEDLDGDLKVLLTEYDENKTGYDLEFEECVFEELSVNIPQSGNYVLVIEKTKR